MTSGARVTRSKSGLTLLEVLAATLVFALVMTTLIGTSSSGVRRVGDTALRLEANQLADAVVADLEIQMRTRIAPVVEQSEWKTEATAESLPYTVRVLNRSIQEALAAPATTVAEEAAGGSSAAEASGPGATRIGGGSGIGAMLATELPEVAKHLHQYDVEVIWEQDDGLHSVTRTTFAFDWQAAQIEYEALFAAAGGGDAGAGANGEGDEEEDGDGPGVPQSGPGGTPRSGPGQRP
ncbi:hypothetical protein K2X89_07670 [Myxococcota bacterium]|nr:hypothetical protein [Myxococcota bacterium]